MTKQEVMTNQTNVNTDEKPIAILMATYNGEKYLAEQIDSILSQTYQNFILYIRDDGSKDNTNKIINDYIKDHPGKIVRVECSKKLDGPAGNFMALLEHVYKLEKHDLFMFSDQDDVWKKDKIEKTLNRYLEEKDKSTPILVYTDLEVVDAELRQVAPSLMKYFSFNPNDNSFNRFLVQNIAPGCTMLMNKTLVKLADFSIESIIMHDSYFTMLASCFGKIIYLDMPTIQYRRHGRNVTEDKNIHSLLAKANKLRKNVVSNGIKEGLLVEIKNVQIFKNSHYPQMSSDKKQIINAFLGLENSNKIKKVFTIIKFRFYRQSFARIIGQIIFS